VRRAGIVIMAWVLLALETALRPTLALWSPAAVPSLVFIFATFIAMCAQARFASWWAIALGLAADLTSPLPVSHAGPPLVVVGPHALAYLAAAHLVLSLRGVVIRRNPLTLGFLTLSAGLVAQSLLITMFWVRHFYDPIIFAATDELFARLAGVAYSALLAVPFALVLIPLAESLGLPNPARGRFGRA
jgi:hypothetical protein